MEQFNLIKCKKSMFDYKALLIITTRGCKKARGNDGGMVRVVCKGWVEGRKCKKRRSSTSDQPCVHAQRQIVLTVHGADFAALECGERQE
jgi:hypothetical protein